MLTIEQTNAIWEALDAAGARFVERHGETGTVRQTEALEEIVGLAIEIGAAGWTREQVLEAWMQQALSFIHVATGRFATIATTSPSEDVDLWNAISRAEHAHAVGKEGTLERVDRYVDAICLRVAKAMPLRSRESIFRAWVMKHFVDIAQGEAVRRSVVPTSGAPN